MFRMTVLSLFLFGLTAGFATAQGWDPATASSKMKERVERADQSINDFKTDDPAIQRFFGSAYGYAVFPRVRKGALGVGGARGSGILYRQGVPTRRARLTQYTLGLQVGGKVYSEIIFFRDQAAYERFDAGDFAFSAQATAVVLDDGAGSTADYADDVAVFIHEKTGLLFEASVGGQNFSTRPLK